MRSRGEIAAVLGLQTSGFGASTIARRAGLPRSTVRGWMDGHLPVGPRALGTEARELGDLPPAYVYLLGLYLGDGCISAHPRGVYRIQIHLDLRYLGIVEECEAAVSAVAPRNRVHRLYRRSHYTGRDEVTHVDVSCYSKNWPVLFPRHGPGRKHERPINLTQWQENAARGSPDLFLRGLIHSDGCRNINTGTNWRNPRYSFSNRSADGWTSSSDRSPSFRAAASAACRTRDPRTGS